MGVIDFATNLNFLGTPPGLKEFLADHVGAIEALPDYRANAARAALARRYSVSVENVCLGVGATDLLYAATKIAPNKTMTFDPTFWEYEGFSKLHGQPTIEPLPQDASTDVVAKSVDESIRAQKPDVVFICNPNNPTTTKFDKSFQLDLARNNESTLFVFDETYLLFENDYWERSLSPQAASLRNVIVITSLSKFFRIPGLRVGLAIASADTMQQFWPRTLPYGPGTLAQLAAAWIADNSDAFAKMSRTAYTTSHEQMVAALRRRLGDHLTIVGAECRAFILAKLRDESVDVKDLIAHLARDGIDIRSGSEFRALGPSYVRMSTKGESAVSALVDSATSYFASRQGSVSST